MVYFRVTEVITLIGEVEDSGYVIKTETKKLS